MLLKNPGGKQIFLSFECFIQRPVGWVFSVDCLQLLVDLLTNFFFEFSNIAKFSGFNQSKDNIVN